MIDVKMETLDSVEMNMRRDIEHVKIKKKAMCPNCFNLFNISFVQYNCTQLDPLDLNNSDYSSVSNLKIRSDIYTSIKVSGNCNVCKNYVSEFALIDINIGDIIQKINNAGLITQFCCEGHYVDGGYSAPYITLYGEYTEEYLNLPDSWKIDYEFKYEGNDGPITRIEPKEKFIRNSKRAWDELEEWIEERNL